MKNLTRNLAVRCAFAIATCIFFDRAQALPRVSFPGRKVNSGGFYVQNPINVTKSRFASIKGSSLGAYRAPTIAFPKRPSVCSDCVCGAGRKTRIVGGTFSDIVDFPWMVGILIQGQFHSGGTLITRRHVLTAAHCVHKFEKKHFELHMGDADITKKTGGVYRRRVKSWIIHEDFDPHSYDNDIAIIVMDRAVPLDGIVHTACLPENSAIDYTGTYATAVGWGRTRENADASKKLRHVRVPVLSEEECEQAGYAESRITKNMFCAGFLEGAKDACHGDSGGPLLVPGPRGNLEIIGITSFGRGCARPRFPGVYTKLTNYLGWLKDQLRSDCVCPSPNPLE